ncbi:hypothetical protein JCM1841_002096 [Sporobolomyces salmonicolor]
MSRIQPLLCTCARPAPSHASVARLVPPSTFVRSRAIHAPAAVVPAKRIPKPREPFHTPAAVLAASKRNLGQYADKFENWAALFSKTSAQLRDEVGMQVKESRYLLWLLEKYRQGHNPDAVAVPPTPKKTIRGWGPRIQNGKRVR